MLPQLVDSLSDDPLPLRRVPGVQQVHRVQDDAQVGAGYGPEDLDRPVRVIDDVLPHRFDGHRHPPVLRPLHHRGQPPEKDLQRLLRVGVGVHFIF